MEARHSGHLVFHWQITEECRSVLLPRLLLQPLVENAVKHGALRRHTDGVVTIRAELVGDAESSRLVCTVEDNGPGLPDAQTRSGGVRVSTPCGAGSSSNSRIDRASAWSSSTEGTRSIVELPWQMARVS